MKAFLFENLKFKQHKIVYGFLLRLLIMQCDGQKLSFNKINILLIIFGGRKYDKV